MRGSELSGLHSRTAGEHISAVAECASHPADSCLKLRDERLPRYSNRYARLRHFLRTTHLSLRRARVPVHRLLHKGLLLRGCRRQRRRPHKPEASDKAHRLPVVATPNSTTKTTKGRPRHPQVIRTSKWSAFASRSLRLVGRSSKK